MATVILLAAFGIFLLIGVPIAFSLGLSSLIYILFFMNDRNEFIFPDGNTFFHSSGGDHGSRGDIKASCYFCQEHNRT